MKLEVRSLSFGYEENKRVLNGISFNVDERQVLGILGSSGCGKSTLLRVISGIISNPTAYFLEGEVKIEGRSDSKQLRSSGRIGMMFQEPSLLPNLTVEQNIIFPLEIIGTRNHQEVVHELIKLVGLSDFRNYLPKHLSGGMQTRAALARTFVTKPDLLLLDEPFSSLDYGWKIDLYEKLDGMIKGFNSTVVLVSHDINEVLLLANRVLLISKQGRIIRDLVVKPEKPTQYKPDSLAAYYEELEREIVLLQNDFIEGKNSSV